MKNIRNLILPVVIILTAVSMRLLPHPANFAPIAAMALFGGTYLSKRYAVLIPISAMIISDFFLGFHATMPYVYASFLISVLIGMWIRNHKSAKNVITGTLASSILFFIITNFGVWLVGGLYPKTLQGALECYVLAIPFFRNTLAGDLFYATVFFGGFELISNLSKPTMYAYLHQKRG